MPRVAYRWTSERLTECRGLYETGVHLEVIASRYAVTASSIRVLASKNGWKRKILAERRPQLNPSPLSLQASPSDHEFNERIAGIIKAYWQEKGKKIEIRSEGLGVRSRSLNGFPVSAQQAKRLRLDGWS